ncbi:MAG TPA: c-type cytochrome [Caulobacteraceae bacterium]|nr:c-type cytochrome [Caulobacteraceae bacterium]
MTARGLACAIALLATVALTACGPQQTTGSQASPRPDHVQATSWAAPSVEALPDDDWGRTVLYGRDLVTRTYALIGPEAPDPHMRFAGNNLACASCHIDAGRQRFGLPLVGVYADFPNYRARSGKVGTIEDRINGCMVRSMNGKPLPAQGREMTAMVAYLKFMSSGVRVGDRTDGRGVGAMPELSRAADPVRGRLIYARTCAACHGADGAGRRTGGEGDAGGYAIPPLWGPDSFNDGAGMDRLIDAANFIHGNMPAGVTLAQPALPPSDAWDVAAFVVSQPRPHMARLGDDYPKREEKPVDAPYGPYADTFGATAHKFGPFGPIRRASTARD